MNAPKIGVIVSDFDYSFQHAIFDGISEMGEKHNYTVVGHSSMKDPRLPQSISLDVAELAGLVVVANALPSAMLQEIHSTGKPISLVSHQVGDLPVVMPSNIQGIAELMRYLVLDCHRRDVVFIRGLMNQHDGRERDIAFRRELIRYNLKFSESRILRGDFEPTVTKESIQELIDSREHFDAVLAAD